MKNPFDDENANFHVLINEEEQYSLWPVFAIVPDGWTIVLENRPRRDCMAFVDEHWKDIRPKSLREALKKQD
ncbi:MAG: MbtH family protein [Neisseriaceae bacterium]